MNYYVVDPSGTQYGPADITTLRQWVQEGRVLPSTTIRDGASGQTMVATAIPGLFPAQSSPYSGSPYTSAPSYTGNPYGGSPYSQQPAQGHGYYPRPGAGSSQTDLIVAWICGVLSVVFAFCVCALLGIPLGIVGVVFGRRATVAGDARGNAPYIISWLGICASVGMMILSFLALRGAMSG